MTVDDVHAVLAALEAAGVDVSVEGGWGVDALVGRQTREHDDLDLAVRREDARAAEEALQALGYRHAADAWPGLPARLVLRDAAARQVDLHPLLTDAEGNGWQETAEGGWYLHPADDLRHEGSIGARPVTCISPSLQLRFHLGYPWREADRHDLRLLAEHCGTPVPPGALD